MALFTNDTLLRFFYQGEDHISHDRPYLVDRVSLALTKDIASYSIPDYVQSIRRITYLGQKLDPLTHRVARNVFQSVTQKGKPFWYKFNNVGLNKIELFPTPFVDVAQVTDPWSGIGIRTGFVIEFYRVTDNNLFVAPAWIRRQLLKQYVAKQCFAIEGQGQNLKLSQYFAGRFEQRKKEFENLLDELYTKPRKLVLTEMVGVKYYPASPVLPIDRFGVSVDDGY